MKPIRRSIQKGFTLVELLIVVIILALLAAIVVPQFSSSTDDAKEAALDSTLANMRAAIDLYYQQHSEYPANKASTADAACTGTSADAAANSTDAFFKQLSQYTDADGNYCSRKVANFVYGPYLKKETLPPNPITGVDTLVIISTGDLAISVNTAGGGWKYDSVVGKFVANDTNNDPGGTAYYLR